MDNVNVFDKQIQSIPTQKQNNRSMLIIDCDDNDKKKLLARTTSTAPSIDLSTNTSSRAKFRKSHTCGSLFAKCSCSSTMLSTTFRSMSISPTDTHIQKSPIHLSPKTFEHAKSDNNTAETVKKTRRLFQSYSHPDTDFIFTDENKNPSKTVQGSVSRITTKSGRVEIKHPKRSSSPNIGQYTILDVAVHPEILVKISPKLEHRDDPVPKSPRLSRPRLQRSQEVEFESNSDSETSLVSSNSPTEESRTKLINTSTLESNLRAAQKYFQESGILGPIQSPHLIRKTSKILQDSNVIEKIRKNSKILRSGKISVSSSSQRSVGTNSPTTGTPGYDDMDYPATLPPILSPKIPKQPFKLRSPPPPSKYQQEINHLAHQSSLSSNTSNSDSQSFSKSEEDLLPEPCNLKIKHLEDEVLVLKNQLKSRDSEICKLKREIHKLKSVLQQTTNHMPIAGDELLTSPVHEVPILFSNNNGHNNERNLSTPPPQTCGVSLTVNDGPIVKKITPSSCALDDSDDTINEILAHKTNQLTVPVLKKQGVSGESCDTAVKLSNTAPIPKYEKDFRSKQLIKDAIMDNDFLKNIDSSQVRELVESMYSLEVAKGEYVIREGEVGAHLYVSADGEFEVIKNGNVLGIMGPGKAFGELAILYNCTRTASIHVIADARLWVLDRRVFQQIMMRTGMQRIEDNVNFLRSVPLLKNLSNDILAKISDVLEVEFYPAGTYIIRQGASGDTFFLISQGSVKVTQKLGTDEKEIRTLERGDYFGEQALINEDKRTANIIALAPGVECLTLDRESFTHLIGDLCELKEKNYGDENRVLAMKFEEQSKEIFGANVKQELPNLALTDLELVTTLGIGGFGRVELVKSYRENRIETYALKCLKKKHIIDTRQEEHVFSERTIMLTCNSPFICRCYRTFRDEKYVYMLLEACMGGEVWTILRDRGSFDETTTQFIIGCVLQAFEYLHSRGIIYRDLKPENLMLDDRGYVKLVDFGFAKYIGNSSKTWTFCGTPEYVAPEIILNKGHDRAVDYWALGILIHELLNGTPPFTANDPMKTYNIILKGIDMIDFSKHIPRAAVMLIKKLCRDAPAERLGYQKGGIQDIKKHKWFQGFDWDGLMNLTLTPPFLRPVSHSMDTTYFDKFPVDCDIPPDETSGWDSDF